jgi:hypothetical protein
MATTQKGKGTTMTRKDFQAFATIFLHGATAANTADEYALVEALAKDAASYFAKCNPRFNRDTFLSACGMREA